MLQQTTVAAVTPYWERFLTRWPNPAALAGASRDELLSAWAGLGYYSRAHRLMDAAQQLEHESPSSAADLRKLPGIGEYTAAAVASIAWDEPVAAVDGNVERVVSRLAALEGDPRKAVGKRAVRRAAQALLDSRRPGDFNQAVMDLGATICKPRTPDCERCPLRSTCRAHALGTQERFPALPPRPKPTPLVHAVALISQRGKILVQQREQSPNAGFLELPCLAWRAGDIDEQGAPREPASMGPRLGVYLSDAHGLRARVGEALPVHRHSITRYRIRVYPFRVTLSSGRVQQPLAWAPSTSEQPFTTATRRILAAALPDFFPSSPSSSLDAS